MKKGILTVVSGFSGSGKGTVMKALKEKYNSYAVSISATTRSPRTEDVEGKTYFFKTVEEFQQMIANGELIEYAKYVDNYYGTPKAYVLDQLEKGNDVILEIETQGALKVKKDMPDTVLVFMTPPSAEELRKRLIGRGTDTMDVIEKRLSTANEEAAVMDQYDYILVNENVDECVDTLHELIQHEKRRTSRNADFICDIREQLKEFWKGEK